MNKVQKPNNSECYTLIQVWKAENTAVGIHHADHVAPSIRKSWH
jgi:hypothetical protein